MKGIRHIVPLCDDTLPTIKVTSYLFEKYWPNHEIHFMGFKEPDFDLPGNHKFVSIAPVQEGGAKKWTRYIADYVRQISEDLILFSLDDFFPTCPIDSDMFNDIRQMMDNNEKIGRFCLSYDASNNCAHSKVFERQGYNVVSINKGALYRISAQPALWKKDYLLKFLDHDWSPWNFEVDGSYMSAGFEEEVYATFDPTFEKVPTRWVNKGSVSRHCPGKVNVLGLSIEAITDLVHQGFYREDQLQWGMWGGNFPIPQFHQLGGYCFNPRYMPPHEASPSNWREFYCTYDKPDETYSSIEQPVIVNLLDRNFIHTIEHPDYGFISANAEPIERTRKLAYVPFHANFHSHSGVTIFTDHFITDQAIDSVNCKKKVAWIMEPVEIHGWAYENVERLINRFDCVLTFDKKMVEKYENCHMFPFVHTTIRSDERKIYEKSKLVSMIASSKSSTSGHRFRKEITDKLASKRAIDLWGRAHKNFPPNGKIESLRDYMFSIDVENCIMDSYFGHIIDIVLTGTVPIFRGGRGVADHFDERGIIFFNTVDELDEILTNLNREEYESRLKFVRENFKIANEKYINSDEQLYEILKTSMTI